MSVGLMDEGCFAVYVQFKVHDACQTFIFKREFSSTQGYYVRDDSMIGFKE